MIPRVCSRGTFSEWVLLSGLLGYIAYGFLVGKKGMYYIGVVFSDSLLRTSRMGKYEGEDEGDEFWKSVVDFAALFLEKFQA